MQLQNYSAMKIFEITNKNLGWLALVDINPEFKEEYSTIVNYLNLYVGSRSANRNSYLKPVIDQFVDKLNRFLELEFPDQNDPDIIQLQEDVARMRDDIIQLTQRLT